MEDAHFADPDEDPSASQVQTTEEQTNVALRSIRFDVLLDNHCPAPRRSGRKGRFGRCRNHRHSGANSRLAEPARRFTLSEARPSAPVHTSAILSPEIDVYRDGVDRTLVRENLKLTAQQRMEKHQRARRTAEELKRAGRRMRSTVDPAR